MRLQRFSAPRVRCWICALLLGAASVGCSPPEVRVTFEDAAPAAGIGREEAAPPRTMAHILDSTGTGVAVADFDGDGAEDVFLVGGNTTDRLLAGEPLRSSRLYRNNDDGSFDDVTAEAGLEFRAWANGAYFVDYDNDGDKDLFVTAWGPNMLFRNEGDGTFRDVTVAAGVQGGTTDWSASAAFGDLDVDGDLDLYVTNYCAYDPREAAAAGMEWIWKGLNVFAGPRGLPGQQDRLFRNDGDGTFTDVTAAAGLRDAAGLYGLAVVFTDVDGDRDPDIYVANDSTVNFLWRNDSERGDLHFTEVGTGAGVATNEDAQTQAGMGADAADFDGDGRFDLIVTNFSHDWNTLYRNESTFPSLVLFTDATFTAGLQDGYLDLAWGARFLDHDNDGWLDLFVANGHIYPQVDDTPRLNSGFKQANKLYRNRGDGTFESVGPTAGPGMAVAESSRGVAVADFDRNGTLDLLVANLDAPPNLLLGRGSGPNRWLAIELVGVGANRDGVGAKLELDVGGRTLVREVNPFGSYLSQSSYRVHFGLGAVTRPERLVIHWPSGHTDLVTGLEAGLVYTVKEQAGIVAESGPGGW